MKQFSLSEYLKNLSRKVVTREGKPARIVCTDAKGKYPVVALITTEENFEIAHHFKEDGTYIDGAVNLSDLFFEEKNTKKKGWINIYKSNYREDEYFTSSIYWDKDDALAHATNSKIQSTVLTTCVEWDE